MRDTTITAGQTSNKDSEGQIGSPLYLMGYADVAALLRRMANDAMYTLADAPDCYDAVLLDTNNALDALQLPTLPLQALRSIAKAAHRDCALRTKGAIVDALRRMVTDPMDSVVEKGG